MLKYLLPSSEYCTFLLDLCGNPNTNPVSSPKLSNSVTCFSGDQLLSNESLYMQVYKLHLILTLLNIHVKKNTFRNLLS